MRRTLSLAAVLLVVAGCASGSQTRVTGGRNTVRGAAAQPLEDFNIIREKIPATLRKAQDAPYAPPEPFTCTGIHFEIAELDDVLGPDADVKDPSPSGRTAQGRSLAEKAAVSAVRDLSTDWIPLRSWVRYLSGAEMHSGQIRKAINAGLMRRAYLKGIAQSQDCPVTASTGPMQFPAPPPTPSSAGG